MLPNKIAIGCCLDTTSVTLLRKEKESAVISATWDAFGFETIIVQTSAIPLSHNVMRRTGKERVRNENKEKVPKWNGLEER